MLVHLELNKERLIIKYVTYKKKRLGYSSLVFSGGYLGIKL